MKRDVSGMLLPEPEFTKNKEHGSALKSESREFSGTLTPGIQSSVWTSFSCCRVFVNFRWEK